jgi:hypothetical protein
MTSNVKKLGLKPGMRALVLGAPSGYLGSLAPLPDGVVVSKISRWQPRVRAVLREQGSRDREIEEEIVGVRRSRCLGLDQLPQEKLTCG